MKYSINIETEKEKSARVGVIPHAPQYGSEAEANPFTAIHLLLILTAVLLTRFSWAPSFLSTDTVNLAYALESFDPLRHQPQPPGYPLFVGFARLIHRFSPSAEVTFWIISVGVTVASASVLYLLAKRMISRWAALAAVILFLLNPIFWFSRLTSPLRPWLALFSLVVAYCAWRCWHGERRFALYGALALGIGTGFRPDVLAYLLPLWVVSTWFATRSGKLMLQGGLIIAGLSGLWMGIVVSAMGGVASTVREMTRYTLEQSRFDSILFADSIHVWLRPISRLVVWNSIALVSWAWAPLIGYRKLSAKNVPWKFLLLWIAPGLVVQLLFHIASPGHTLFATPVLCLTGAYLIFAMGRYRNAILVSAATISSAIYLNAVPLGYPPPANATLFERAMTSLRNSVSYGTFETSQDRLRWWEETTEVSLQELWRFSVNDRPNLMIAQNGNETEFDFIYWRVVSYYDPRPMWLLLDHLPPGQPGRIRFIRGKEIRTTELTSITLPRSGRILWIMQLGGHFHRALEQAIPVQCGHYICYSDIPADLRPFEIQGFRFIPSEE